MLCYFIVFKSEKIENILILKDLAQINSIDYLKYLPVIILIIGIYYIIKRLLIIMSNTNIEKFNLQNIELISNSNSASLLNKYLR